MEDPAYLSQFEEQGVLVVVSSLTQTLLEVLHQLSHVHAYLDENTIWHFMYDLAESMVTSGINQAVFHPREFHLKDNKLFYRHAQIASDNTMQVVNNTGAAIYEAPELLMRQGEKSSTSTWVFGCIAYEMAALEPAFHDRDKTGNVMAVMVAITRGALPPRIPDQYSDALWEIITCSLVKQAENRPSLLDIKERIGAKIEEL